MAGKNRAVAITGIGIVSALGNSWPTFWNSCLDGRTVVDAVPDHWQKYYSAKSKYWSPLQCPDYSSIGLSRSVILSTDTAVLNALHAATEAVRHSACDMTNCEDRAGHYQLDSFDAYRCGVFIGTGLGCITSVFQNYVPHILGNIRSELKQLAGSGDSNSTAFEISNYLNSHPRVLPVASIKSMANSLSAQIAIRFGLKGPNETCVTACAAGASAISRAYDLIAAGKLDFALAGGSEFYGDRAGGVFMAFDRLGTLANGEHSPNAINRPFDRTRSGFLFSQGAACVLALETVLSAKSRGAPIIAVIKGTGATSDAYSLAAIDQSGVAIRQMISACLSDADISPNEIDYVNSHGTGTLQNDQLEAEVIARTFPHMPWINTTKSLLGHTIGACGAIEAAVAAYSIYAKELHPNLNIDDPIRDLKFVRRRQSADINFAFSQNFGFGGHNSGLIFGTV